MAIEKERIKKGVSYLGLFIVAMILIAFIFLVLANITGAAISAMLGIGATVIR